MLKGFIEDLKDSTGASLRMTSLVALSGFAGFIALCFICAAIFIAVLRSFGPVTACVTIAAIFLLLSALLAAVYSSRKRRLRQRAEAAARSAAKAAASKPMIDPMMVATGIQVARAVGLKKLIPLLALAGAAAGYMATRGQASAPDDSDDDGEPDADQA